MNDRYLRPMTAIEIIGNAFRVYREHFALLVMVALVPHLVLLMLDTVLLLPGPPAPGVMMILGLATLVTNGIALAAIAVAICRSIVGQELGFARTYAFTFRENVLGVVVAVLTPTLLVSALAVPALLTGAVPVLLPLLVLVALAVGALLAPTIPIIIVEHKGAFEAMARSIVMMRRELLKGVAVFSFFIAITGLLPLFLFWIQAGIGMGPFTPLLSIIIASVTLPLGFAANVLLYFSLRAEGGFGMEQLQAELERALPP